MAELKITATNFENEVLRSDKPVLLDFYALWEAEVGESPEVRSSRPA